MGQYPSPGRGDQTDCMAAKLAPDILEVLQPVLERIWFHPKLRHPMRRVALRVQVSKYIGVYVYIYVCIHIEEVPKTKMGMVFGA